MKQTWYISRRALNLTQRHHMSVMVCATQHSVDIETVGRKDLNQVL